MKIIRLLIKNSGKSFLLAAIFSFISGASSAGLIALINYILQNINSVSTVVVISFISLCLSLMVSSAVSWILLTQLSQDVIYNLRLELTQRILACPLNQLEALGTPKLLAAITEDVNTIAGSFHCNFGYGNQCFPDFRLFSLSLLVIRTTILPVFVVDYFRHL